MKYRKILFLIFVNCLLLKGGTAFATVLNFNQDGSVTKFEATDYLTNQRRTSIPSKATNYKYKNDYQDIILDISLKYSVDNNLITSVIGAESSFRADAISPKGAEGLMQLMPHTAKRFNVSDSFDPKQNIQGGTRYLKFLIERYNGNIDYVLAAYNAGEGAVDKYEGIPPYPETQNYVSKIKQALALQSR